MTSRRILVGVTLLVLFMGCRTDCFAQQKAAVKTIHKLIYRYDTPGIHLEGRLVSRKVYGPPGYGETPAEDARNTILILKLSHAITVKPLPDAKAKNSSSLGTAANIHEVQLFVYRIDTAEVHKSIGKIVVVVGTLHEAVAPSQYTKVSLDLDTLSLK
jgi:hypothetical protein